jgi:hypothetical protein
VEQLTLVVRRFEIIRKPTKRYTLLDFHYAFVLYTIDEKHNSFKEKVDLIEDKLLKETMV